VRCWRDPPPPATACRVITMGVARRSAKAGQGARRCRQQAYDVGSELRG
jgi:hypothetical protein